MRDEVVDLLQPQRGGLFVDCTLGLGGHARALIEAGASRLIGFDRDPAALTLAAEALAEWKDRVELVHADYRGIATVLDARGVTAVSGVLADLGVSSMQLESEGRGFSFRRDEPLDMRMDTTAGETAAEMLATVDETDLANVIYQFGEERHSRRIARALVRARAQAPLTSTEQVAAIVRRAQPGKGWQRIDPATRTFQALRIWVNRELDGLDAFLQTAASRLEQGARLAVIAFHSLEDRIVKHTFRALAASDPSTGLGTGPSTGLRAGMYRIVTKRPLTATDEETAANPRARSAKLRVLERAA
jgi:16S rRNA (cytosine1402-N4)-methyltransferase